MQFSGYGGPDMFGQEAEGTDMTPRQSGSEKKTALVIGATGGIGGEVARALIRHGWQVRGLCRNPEIAARGGAWIGPVEWVAGDAMVEADVTRAATGAALIFHGANPPRLQELA
jgi:uncharacterized protein YbjT (DUF2867 family)